MEANNINGYKYQDASHNAAHNYLLPVLLNIINNLNLSYDKRQIFELGCGNGSVAAFLKDKGLTALFLWIPPSHRPLREGCPADRQS